MKLFDEVSTLTEQLDAATASKQELEGRHAEALAAMRAEHESLVSTLRTECAAGQTNAQASEAMAAKHASELQEKVDSLRVAEEEQMKLFDEVSTLTEQLDAATASKQELKGRHAELEVKVIELQNANKLLANSAAQAMLETS